MKNLILIGFLLTTITSFSQNDSIHYEKMELAILKKKSGKFKRIKTNSRVSINLNNPDHTRYAGKYRIIDSNSIEIKNKTIDLSEIDKIRYYKSSRTIYMAPAVAGTIIGFIGEGGIDMWEGQGVITLLIGFPSMIITTIISITPKHFKLKGNVRKSLQIIPLTTPKKKRK